MKLRLIESAFLLLFIFSSAAFAQSALNVKDSLGNSLLFIRSDGNIGLGSMNPLVRLQVMGDVRSSVLSGRGSRLLFADDRGTIFARGTLPKPGWSLTGNLGINPDSNFIGTLDERALIFRTGGNAHENERMRILPEGGITVNSAGFRAGDLFAVYGRGYSGAINTTEGMADYPVNGYSTGGFSGVYGENTDNGDGVLGVNTSSGAGVFGQNTSVGSGLKGASLKGFGAAGLTGSRGAAGVMGRNKDSLGTGIIALGSGLNTALLIEGGSGISSAGKSIGLFSTATDSISGTGILAGGNSLDTLTMPLKGAGVTGNGRYFGVTGFAHSDTSKKEKWGGYFEASGAPDSYAFTGGSFGKTGYGILSSGTNAVMVKDGKGEHRVMFNPASPEVVLEDYGTGQLERGFSHVSLDSLFSRAITVDDVNPVKVFVQVEGDCNGVFVTNKTKEGFDVRELKGGRSHVYFSWHVVATRGNSISPDGKVEDFSSLRFPKGPGKPEVKVLKTSITGAGSEQVLDKNKKHPSEYKKQGGKKKRK
ncbi:MAG: hypothetical protein HF308_09670 [Ignavibacteria bacterium]|jgi:hypothetical protein|nr:hypothetical protein [Ignavibacteria bacterium]MCU7520478.1 hypothetical protein [Ignavibacteria bacterium]MCU7524730.1 hypothetical protein [Ignavibacteria bacterium]